MSVLPSDLLVSVEFVGILIVCIFFSMMYELNRTLTWSGIIAGITWNGLGLFNLVVFGSYSGTSTLALFFHGIGLLYIIRIMVDIVQMRNLGRKMESDY